MRLLLDTCTFIWLATGHANLSPVARALFADPANEVWLSAVSSWEIGVKCASGKLSLPEGLNAREFVLEARRRHQIETLPIEVSATFELLKLPAIHADPFDRLLICQAIAHQMSILTPDPLIQQYPVSVRW
jgi:PIN domain nuclease of toxin-antitoxin system